MFIWTIIVPVPRLCCLSKRRFLVKHEAGVTSHVRVHYKVHISVWSVVASVLCKGLSARSGTSVRSHGVLLSNGVPSEPKENSRCWRTVLIRVPSGEAVNPNVFWSPDLYLRFRQNSNVSHGIACLLCQRENPVRNKTNSLKKKEN